MGNFKWNWDLAKKLLAEYTATSLLITLGCSASQFSKADDLGLSSIVEQSFGWGFAYVTAIHCFAFLSGAHVNPWVTICATILGVIEWQLMLCYLVCQLLGAFAGFALVHLALPEKHGNVCLTLVRSGFDEWKVVLIEFLICAVLLFAYCAIWDSRSNRAYDSISLRIGLIVCGLCFSTFTFSGCSLNFARTLAPAVIQLEFSGIWTYFAGQCLAAVLVPVLWRFVIAVDEPDKQDE